MHLLFYCKLLTIQQTTEAYWFLALDQLLGKTVVDYPSYLTKIYEYKICYNLAALYLAIVGVICLCMIINNNHTWE